MPRRQVDRNARVLKYGRFPTFLTYRRAAVSSRTRSVFITIDALFRERHELGRTWRRIGGRLAIDAMGWRETGRCGMGS